MSHAARLVSMHAHDETMTILLRTDEAEIPITVELTPTTARALRPLHALHAHTTGCHNAPPSQLHVDLLIRTLGCLDARPTCVVVRPGPRPAFWLRIDGRHGPREIDLDVLDAVCLLLSRRIDVELTDTAVGDWDHALRELVARDDRERRP